MKRLLLITTGGTIASGHSKGGGLSPEKRGAQMLPETEGISFDVLDLFAVDSTDITPSHWRKLYDAVTENLPGYDGIVILHGTDTMAYTGAVLAFTVNTDKPVILTGSMIPSGEPESDAPGNILSAAIAAKHGRYKGVWLVFANRVIRGEDIIKINSTEKDAFRSYSGFKTARTFHFPDRPDAFPAVVRLTPFTSPAELHRTAEGHRSVIVETYGAGGLPEGEITETISELAKYIRIIITTPCIGGTDLERYGVGRRALAAGVISGGKMSTECAAVSEWLRLCGESN